MKSSHCGKGVGQPKRGRLDGGCVDLAQYLLAPTTNKGKRGPPNTIKSVDVLNEFSLRQRIGNIFLIDHHFTPLHSITTLADFLGLSRAQVRLGLLQ